MVPEQTPIRDSLEEVSPEAAEIIRGELGALHETVESLDSQLQREGGRFERERARARELTSALVATRRDDDRYLLASDEAVSHQLAANHDEAISTLESLKTKPYFARVILEEEDDSGATKRVEYKIGYAANAMCRIVDWRRAPLSRLYYEYREGDDYCEEIQGRERVGRVALRHSVEIEKSELKQLTCRLGTFRLSPAGWTGSAKRAGSSRDFSALPEVLSLITPDQFRTITRDVESPILIQGVAGSGKTTVALHRLAWLLETGNSDVAPKDCLVITLGPSLREYIKSSLTALRIPSVPVFSYRAWCGKQIAPHLPPALRSGENGEPQLTPGSNRPPAGVERVKRSMGLLRALEEFAKSPSRPTGPLEFLLAVLSRPQLIEKYDETKLIDKVVIREAHQRTAGALERGTLDRSDFSLLLRCLQLTLGAPQSAGRSEPYKHVVIDEVQDYSPIELATVLSGVRGMGNLTLVGDTNQQIEEGFPGWEKLRKWWGTKELETSLVRLQVSHRSTREIMACAAAIGENEVPRGGRSGRKPRWMFSRGQEAAIGGMIDWLHEVTRDAPTALVGVLCFSPIDVREVHSLLTPTFGPMVRIADESSFSFGEGIVVCEAQTARGLEFFGILVYQPTAAALPKGAAGRNLLYIASTRAQERLSFVTFGSGPSPLSVCPERVLNRIDLDEVEEEEVETVDLQEDD